MAEKTLKKPFYEEALDLFIELAKEIREEYMKGRTLIFVDKKLLEWVDKQVEARKYDSRSHVIETLIQKEIESQ